MTAVVVLALGSLLASFLDVGGVFGSNRGDPSPAFFGRKALEAGGASAWFPSPEAALKRGVAASSVRSSAPPEAGSPAPPHGFYSSSTAQRSKGGMADEGDERPALELRAKGRRACSFLYFKVSRLLCSMSVLLGSPHTHLLQAIEAESGGASPPPPPPPNPSEERVTKKVLTIIGCVLSVIVHCNPIIIFWSTRSNMASTVAFCTMTDFVSSSLSTGSWLVFALVQLNGRDGSILGLEAVLANAVGLTLLTAFITVKLTAEYGMSDMVCRGSLFGFAIVIGVCVCSVIFVPVKRDTLAANQISILAGVLQVISQLIPFRSVWVLYHPPARPSDVRILNMRSLLVYSRASSFMILLYWAMYATLTYQHTVFEVASITSTVLGFVTLCLHLVYALWPTEENQDHGR